MPYDDPPPRRRVNVTLSEPLCEEAKTLGLNVSRAAEAGLAAAVKAEKERRWLEENADAIAAYNARISREGVAFPPAWLEED